MTPVGLADAAGRAERPFDDEARATAARSGVELLRAGTVADHPDFTAMLASLVQSAWSKAR